MWKRKVIFLKPCVYFSNCTWNITIMQFLNLLNFHFKKLKQFKIILILTTIPLPYPWVLTWIFDGMRIRWKFCFPLFLVSLAGSTEKRIKLRGRSLTARREPSGTSTDQWWIFFWPTYPLSADSNYNLYTVSLQKLLRCCMYHQYWQKKIFYVHFPSAWMC